MGGTPDKCAKKAAKGTSPNPATGKCEKGAEALESSKSKAEGEKVGKESAKEGAKKEGAGRDCSGTCWESKTKDYPKCVGWDAAGYKCKGDNCAACDPKGTPDKCAKKAAKGTSPNPLTGKCEKAAAALSSKAEKDEGKEAGKEEGRNDSKKEGKKEATEKGKKEGKKEAKLEAKGEGKKETKKAGKKEAKSEAKKEGKKGAKLEAKA